MTAIPNWLDGRRALVVGSGDAADAVATDFATAGARVHRLGEALDDAPAVAAAFDSAEQGLGAPVDLLVHAGTPLGDASTADIDLAAWRGGFSADIDGRFFHAAELARRLVGARLPGTILYLMPSPRMAAGRAAAATAHGTLDNLVKSLAVEWGRDGIRVNAIASRVVEAYDAATPTQRTSLTSLGAYLCSDYGAYITGCVMGVDEV
jgi:NAD(P)-dependent dehydrogenase (short-subunit alcohol dehydrogenase family)